LLPFFLMFLVEPVPHRATVYLDFDGETLTQGDDASKGEASCLLDESLSYPWFFGTADDAAAIAEEARELLSAYGVRVAWEEPPPTHLPYTRVMMGGRAESLGQDPHEGGASCVIDCADAWPRDMAFVFTDEASSSAAALLARIAVHEVAHTWGLEHVEGTDYLMSGFVTDEDQGFAESCVPLVGGSECEEVHELFCDPGQQNSHAELLALFGPNTPDTTPPTVEILSPEDGTHVPPGTEITVEVAVADDFGGFGWKIAVPELGWEQAAAHGETTWVLPFPEGDFTIVAEAIDHDRNVAQDSVSVRVDWNPDATDTSPSTDTSDAPQLGEPATSCACRSGHRPLPWTLGLCLLVCAALRRRVT
jgi:hypothetical protein